MRSFSASATSPPQTGAAAPGSAEFVALKLGPRALGCNHFPKYRPSLEGNDQKYPAVLGFFHQSQIRHSQVCISVLETCRFCVNCLSQATPDGYVFWSIIAEACSPDASTRKKENWLAIPGSSVNYPPFFQAGAEGFSGLFAAATSSTPEAQPSTVAIPKIPGAEQAWGWINTQRKPFYIDQLHLAKRPWSHHAEKTAELDVTIVQKFGVPFTGVAKSKAPKPKTPNGLDPTVPSPPGSSHQFARPPGPMRQPHERSASTPAHLQPEVKSSRNPKLHTDPTVRSSTTRSVSSSNFVDELFISQNSHVSLSFSHSPPQSGSSFLQLSQPTNPTASPLGRPVSSEHPGSLVPGLPKPTEVKRKPIKAYVDPSSSKTLPEASSDKTSATRVVPSPLKPQKSTPTTAQPATTIEKATAPARSPKNVPAQPRSNTPSLASPGQESLSPRGVSSKVTAAGSSSRRTVSTASAAATSTSRTLASTHSPSITQSYTSDVDADHGASSGKPGHVKSTVVGSSTHVSTLESHGSAAAKAKSPRQFTTNRPSHDPAFLNRATAPQLPKENLPTARPTTSSLSNPLSLNKPATAPGPAPYTQRAANPSENEAGRLDLKVGRGQDSHAVRQVSADRGSKPHTTRGPGTAPVSQPRFVSEEAVVGGVERVLVKGALEADKKHQVKPVSSRLEAPTQQTSKQNSNPTVNQTVQQSSQKIRIQATSGSATPTAKKQPIVQQQQTSRLAGSQQEEAAGSSSLRPKIQKVVQKFSHPGLQKVPSSDPRFLGTGLQRQVNTSSSDPGAKSKQSVQHTIQAVTQQNFNQNIHQNVHQNIQLDTQQHQQSFHQQNIQQPNFQQQMRNNAQQNFHQPPTRALGQDLPHPSKQPSQGVPSTEGTRLITPRSSGPKASGEQNARVTPQQSGPWKLQQSVPQSTGQNVKETPQKHILHPSQKNSQGSLTPSSKQPRPQPSHHGASQNTKQISSGIKQTEREIAKGQGPRHKVSQQVGLSAEKTKGLGKKTLDMEDARTRSQPKDKLSDKKEKKKLDDSGRVLRTGRNLTKKLDATSHDRTKSNTKHGKGDKSLSRRTPGDKSHDKGKKPSKKSHGNHSKLDGKVVAGAAVGAVGAGVMTYVINNSHSTQQTSTTSHSVQQNAVYEGGHGHESDASLSPYITDTESNSSDWLSGGDDPVTSSDEEMNTQENEPPKREGGEANFLSTRSSSPNNVTMDNNKNNIIINNINNINNVNNTNDVWLEKHSGLDSSQQNPHDMSGEASPVAEQPITAESEHLGSGAIDPPVSRYGLLSPQEPNFDYGESKTSQSSSVQPQGGFNEEARLGEADIGLHTSHNGCLRESNQSGQVSGPDSFQAPYYHNEAGSWPTSTEYSNAGGTSSVTEALQRSSPAAEAQGSFETKSRNNPQGPSQVSDLFGSQSQYGDLTSNSEPNKDQRYAESKDWLGIHPASHPSNPTVVYAPSSVPVNSGNRTDHQHTDPEQEQRKVDSNSKTKEHSPNAALALGAVGGVGLASLGLAAAIGNDHLPWEQEHDVQGMTADQFDQPGYYHGDMTDNDSVHGNPHAMEEASVENLYDGQGWGDTSSDGADNELAPDSRDEYTPASFGDETETFYDHNQYSGKYNVSIDASGSVQGSWDGNQYIHENEAHGEETWLDDEANPHFDRYSEVAGHNEDNEDDQRIEDTYGNQGIESDNGESWDGNHTSADVEDGDGNPDNIDEETCDEQPDYNDISTNTWHADDHENENSHSSSENEDMGDYIGDEFGTWNNNPSDGWQSDGQEQGHFEQQDYQDDGQDNISDLGYHEQQNYFEANDDSGSSSDEDLENDGSETYEEPEPEDGLGLDEIEEEMSGEEEVEEYEQEEEVEVGEVEEYDQCGEEEQEEEEEEEEVEEEIGEAEEYEEDEGEEEEEIEEEDGVEGYGEYEEQDEEDEQVEDIGQYGGDKEEGDEEEEMEQDIEEDEEFEEEDNDGCYSDNYYEGNYDD